MGAGCSNKPDNSMSRDRNDEGPSNYVGRRNSMSMAKRFYNPLYSDFKFLNPSSSNLMIFTSMNNYNNEFTVIEGEKKDVSVNNSVKVQGVAVGYHKGYKLDVYNQDKFFVLVNGNVEIYCMLDGHGPYGNIVAQIVQDMLFKEISIDVILSDDFETDYEKILENIFEEIHEYLIKRENISYTQEFDLYLSGTALTLVIKKDNVIYCANVGNVLALLFYAEKIYSYKFKMKELSLNNSAFSVEKESRENLELKTVNSHNANMMNISSPVGNYLQTQKTFLNVEQGDQNINKMHKNFDVNEELRRIYEFGGEIRKLAGEDKFRIFLKGKYFPGLINTRSIGDQIGSNIGILHTPHISRYTFQEKNKYYLIMCTDGITNVLKSEAIVNIIENNDVCKLIGLFI
jgi:serine/threonine protein phosphatase PrpC